MTSGCMITEVKVVKNAKIEKRNNNNQPSVLLISLDNCQNLRPKTPPRALVFGEQKKTLAFEEV